MIVVCISFYIIIYLVLSPGIFNLRMVRFEVPNIQNLVFINFLCYVLLVAGKLDVFLRKRDWDDLVGVRFLGIQFIKKKLIRA